MKMRAMWACVVAGSLLSAAAASTGSTARDESLVGAPRTFYVSAAGADDRDGLSPDRAWRSIDRVNIADLTGGDQVLFEGGQTFVGALLLHRANVRVGEAPLVIGSYGGRATLASGSNGAVTAVGVGGIEVRDLTLRGGGAASGASGLIFLNDTRTTLAHVHVHDVEISGYTNAIYMAAGEAPARYERVRLERLDIHDNAMGPSLWGYFEAPPNGATKAYGLRDVYIGHSRSHRNTGGGLSGGYGSGLFILNAEDVIVEHNTVHDNGGDNPEKSPNGPSGITIYDGRNVLVQHNEVFHQRFHVNNQTDNGGIDLWAQRALVQYNYVHDNEGWGFIFGSASGPGVAPGTGWLSGDVTLRYNIAERNARRLPGRDELAPYAGATVLMFGQIENFDISSKRSPTAARVCASGDECAVRGPEAVTRSSSPRTEASAVSGTGAAASASRWRAPVWSCWSPLTAGKTARTGASRSVSAKWTT